MKYHIKNHSPGTVIPEVKTFRDYLVDWVVADMQPLNVVESKEFRNVLYSISKENLHIPSEDTVRLDIDHKFELQKRKLISILARETSKISLVVDIYTLNLNSFLGKYTLDL